MYNPIMLFCNTVFLGGFVCAYTYVYNKPCSYSVSGGTEVRKRSEETTLEGQSVDQGCNFKGQKEILVLALSLMTTFSHHFCRLSFLWKGLGRAASLCPLYCRYTVPSVAPCPLHNYAVSSLLVSCYRSGFPDSLRT